MAQDNSKLLNYGISLYRMLRFIKDLFEYKFKLLFNGKKLGKIKRQLLIIHMQLIIDPENVEDNNPTKKRRVLKVF